MPERILQKKLGASNIYLISGTKGYLMVDAGSPRNFRSFQRFLHRERIQPKDIKLILITHVHNDHVGNLQRIKELTGAQIMVHQLESEWLANGWVEIPKGIVPLYRFISEQGRKRGYKLKFRPVKADIKINKKISLEEYGLDAEVIPTPGHSIGSLSLVFSTGIAIVGDSCFNFPEIKRTILPGFAEDIEALFKTWKFYLDSDIHTFYPGHGKPFGKEKIERTFEVRGYLLEENG